MNYNDELKRMLKIMNEEEKKETGDGSMSYACLAPCLALHICKHAVMWSPACNQYITGISDCQLFNRFQHFRADFFLHYFVNCLK